MKKIVSFTLALACISSAFAIAPTLENAARGGNVSVVAENTQPLFVHDEKTDYTIVYSDTISTTERMAVSEFVDVMYIGTGIVIKSVVDTGLTYSADDAYICIGENDYSKSAGVTVNKEAVGSNGYHLETKGNSAFILGGGIYGTTWGVYDFLGEQLGYKCYTEEELVFDEAKCEKSALVSVNKDVKPDWEWRVAGDGEICNNKDLRTKLRMVELSDAWTTSGEIPSAHNYFGASSNTAGFVPLDPFYNSKPEWFSADTNGNQVLQSLCFTRDPEGLSNQILSKMIGLIEISGANETVNINFTQMDGPGWCYCSSCRAIMDTHGGANSSTLIPFLKNYLSPKLKDYVEKNCPEKKVTVYAFAYWNTKQAPIVSDSQISEMSLPDNMGIQYCLGFPDRRPLEQAGELSIINQWKKICKNFAVWDYAENFGNYLSHYDDQDRLHENISYFQGIGGKLYFNQQANNTMGNSDWSRLHAYLTANLCWDVDANVNELTIDFFNNYYKDAAPAMLEWYYSYKTWSKLFDNSTGGGVPFPLEQCNNYQSFADQAFKAIAKYKYSDPNLYEQLYDRINLETICYRYAMVASYQYALDDAKAYVEQFKLDCAHFNITHYSESQILENWLSGVMPA